MAETIDSPLLTRGQAMAFLGLKRTAFGIIQKNIPGVRLNKRKGYLLEDLQFYINQRKEIPCQKQPSKSSNGKVRRTGSTASQWMGKSLEEVLGRKTR